MKLQNDWGKYFWDIDKLENPTPVYYEVTLSNYCNLDCSFCCSKDLRANYTQKFMSEETFKEILGKAAKNKMGFVITGGGESTLHPKFKYFVDLAIKSLERNEIISLNLVTNGTNISNLKYFIENTSEPKSWVRISINDRELDKEAKLYKLILKYKGRCGLSFIYDKVFSKFKCETNAYMLKPFAKFCRVREAITTKKENYSYKDCIGHRFVKVFEVDGSTAFCCWSRGLGGMPPKKCPDGCRWQCVDLEEAKALNPFS